MAFAVVLFLRRPDCLLENTLDLRQEITGVIRLIRPAAVLTIDPWTHYQTYADHRAAGAAALDAAYSAKGVNLFPEQLVEGVEPWRVKKVYLFWTGSPDTWVDIGR